MGIQIFQSLWLHLIAGATLYGEIRPGFSPRFCREYAGDFHYQQPWDLDGRTGRDSPTQLALRSFAALATFRSILTASKTDIVKFIEKESTMPWCKHSQQTLMSLFSLQSQEYKDSGFLFRTTATCRYCHRHFLHDELLDWEEIVVSVEAGNSLASLLDSVSNEQKHALACSVLYCETCEMDMQTLRESDESQDDEAEDSDGNMESDSEDDEDPVSGMQVSGMGYEQTEEGADANSSDESSSSRSFSDEDSGEEAD